MRTWGLAIESGFPTATDPWNSPRVNLIPSRLVNLRTGIYEDSSESRRTVTPGYLPDVSPLEAGYTSDTPNLSAISAKMYAKKRKTARRD